MAVDQALVDFVGNHHQVMGARHCRDLLQVLLREHGAGGVVGIADEDSAGARRQARLEVRALYLKVMRDVGADWYADAAGHFHRGRIAYEAGLDDQHLVARVEQSPECEE